MAQPAASPQSNQMCHCNHATAPRSQQKHSQLVTAQEPCRKLLPDRGIVLYIAALDLLLSRAAGAADWKEWRGWSGLEGVASLRASLRFLFPRPCEKISHERDDALPLVRFIVARCSQIGSNALQHHSKRQEESFWQHDQVWGAVSSRSACIHSVKAKNARV